MESQKMLVSPNASDADKKAELPNAKNEEDAILFSEGSNGKPQRMKVVNKFNNSTKNVKRASRSSSLQNRATADDDSTPSPELKEKAHARLSLRKKVPEKPPRKLKSEESYSNSMEPSFKVIEREMQNIQQKIRNLSDKKSKSNEDSKLISDYDVSFEKVRKCVSRETSPTKNQVIKKTDTRKELLNIKRNKKNKNDNYPARNGSSSDVDVSPERNRKNSMKFQRQNNFEVTDTEQSKDEKPKKKMNDKSESEKSRDSVKTVTKLKSTKLNGKDSIDRKFADKKENTKKREISPVKKEKKKTETEESGSSSKNSSTFLDIDKLVSNVRDVVEKEISSLTKAAKNAILNNKAENSASDSGENKMNEKNSIKSAQITRNVTPNDKSSEILLKQKGPEIIINQSTEMSSEIVNKSPKILIDHAEPEMPKKSPETSVKQKQPQITKPHKISVKQKETKTVKPVEKVEVQKSLEPNGITTGPRIDEVPESNHTKIDEDKKLENEVSKNLADESAVKYPSVEILNIVEKCEVDSKDAAMKPLPDNLKSDSDSSDFSDFSNRTMFFTQPYNTPRQSISSETNLADAKNCQSENFSSIENPSEPDFDSLTICKETQEKFIKTDDWTIIPIKNSKQSCCSSSSTKTISDNEKQNVYLSKVIEKKIKTYSRRTTANKLFPVVNIESDSATSDSVLYEKKNPRNESNGSKCKSDVESYDRRTPVRPSKLHLNSRRHFDKASDKAIISILKKPSESKYAEKASSPVSSTILEEFNDDYRINRTLTVREIESTTLRRTYSEKVVSENNELEKSQVNQSLPELNKTLTDKSYTKDIKQTSVVKKIEAFSPGRIPTIQTLEDNSNVECFRPVIIEVKRKEPTKTSKLRSRFQQKMMMSESSAKSPEVGTKLTASEPTEPSSSEKSSPRKTIDHILGRDPEIANARSRYMAWYHERRADQKGKSQRDKKEAKKSTPEKKSKLKIRPLQNVESEQLRAIIKQGRKMRRAEGSKDEDPSVQIFATEKPKNSSPTDNKGLNNAQSQTESDVVKKQMVEVRHHLKQHSEHKFEKVTFPFYLHLPPSVMPQTMTENQMVSRYKENSLVFFSQSYFRNKKS